MRSLNNVAPSRFQEDSGSKYGTEILLTGNVEDLALELEQVELIYTRSPAYNGADTIQVPKVVESDTLPPRVTSTVCCFPLHMLCYFLSPCCRLALLCAPGSGL